VQQERLDVRPLLGDEVLCAKGAPASENDGGTRRSFASTDPGLSERLDVLASERAKPWWRRLVG
jgi:hypothetical protein